MPDKKIAHFEIMEMLGQGGMGIVYKARDTRQDKVVALKVLSGSGLPSNEIRRRFDREASVGLKLVHPNIVRIFEIGDERGEFYISMEFIEGKTLRQLLQENPLESKRVIDIGISVCEALKQAHEIGIIHRDMKGDNIMLTSQGDVKVMDFGIAKIQDASILTQEGTVLGTAAYMSPEQAIGEPVDHRSDIFSLGVVLFEALTGQLPFDAAYELAVIYSIVNEEPLALRELNKDIPEPLEQVIMKAMRKELQHRYQSVEDFAGDLTKVKAFLEGKPGMITSASELLATVGWTKTEERPTYVRVAGRRVFQARLAGRDEQFEILKTLFSRTAEGEGQTVFIAGEAGIGKTRLVLELEKYARTMKIRMLTGRCPFRQGVYPYQPFVETIRDYFDVQGVTTGKKLEEFIDEKAPELASQLPVIRVFLNIEEGEKITIDSKEQLWDAIFRLIVTISKERPFILFIDDLHWADENTLGLLLYTSRNTVKSRVMIVGTYRPEDLRTTSGERTHPLLEIQREMEREEILTVVRLERLKETDIQQIVDSLFQDSDFSTSFYDSLYKETDGNPFFVMETLKLLKMEGVIEKENGGYRLREDYEQIVIPNTIHDIVMRRIERLNEEEREILEIGAVEGEAFHSDTVGNCLELNRIKLLRKLQALERDHHIIYPRDKMYYFDHGKIREFLYDAITPELRIEYHLMIGDYLSDTYGGEERFAPNIAHHFIESEREHKALPFLITAGEGAKVVFANEQAIDFYHKALDIIHRSEGDEARVEPPEGKDIVLEGLGDVLALTGKHDEALENYHTLINNPNTSSPRHVELLWKLGAAHLSKGEHDKALAFLDRAEEEYDENLRSIKEGGKTKMLNDEDFNAKKLFTSFGKIKFSKARVYKANGEYQEAKQEIEKGLEILEDEGNYKEKAQAYNDFGNILFDQGDYKRSTEMYLQSLDLREKIEDKKGVADSYGNLANVYCEEGNYTKAAEMLERANKILIEIGFRIGIAGTYVNLGTVYQNLGRYDDSLKMHQRSLEISEEIGNTPILVLSYSNLGSVYNDLQNFELAKEYLEKGLKLMDDMEFKVFESQGLIWLSQALLGLGQLSDANEVILRAYKNAEDLNQKAYQGLAKRVLGAIGLKRLEDDEDTLRDKKARDSVEIHLEESLKIFEEMKMEHEIGRTCLEFARFYRLTGNDSSTEKFAHRAREIFQNLGAMGDLEKVNLLITE